MARQQILWTVMPYGREHRAGPLEGRRRVSIVVSPRLTPEAADEQVLGAFAEWLDWPQTLLQLEFRLEIGGDAVRLERIEDPALAPDSALWQRLFPATLGVAGFQFKDMSQVNLRSFPVRHVLGFVRRHYTALSLQAGSGEHPTLLPWQAADPALKGMLGELGTRTQRINFGRRSIEVLLPGFDRFHDASEGDAQTSRHDRLVDGSVFGRDSCIQAPATLPGRDGATSTFRLRALPPDWEDPAAIRGGAIAVDPADRERRAQLMEQFSGPAEYALWQGDRFYRRTRPTQKQLAMRRPTMVGGTDPVKPPEWDFHQRLASYADHPNLLRRLGLVIDCVLGSEEAIDALVAAASPASGVMRLHLGGGPPHDPGGDVFPRTAWRATQRRFVIQARTRDHEDGLLRLDRANDRFQNMDPREGSPFDVYQIDSDGAALKTVNFAMTAQRLVGKSLAMGADGEVTYTTGDRQAVATMRSAGIGASRHGRAGQVAMAAADAALIHGAIGDGGGSPDLTLYAEDALRGYRVDILDSANGRWLGLCDRQGEYAALPAAAGDADLPVDLPKDEGYVKGASTTSNPDKPDDHYLHETLFRWTGWSLAVPRPGRTVRDRTEPGTGLQSEEVVDVEDTATNGNGLRVRFKPVKGALPRLRFGHEYRVRARLVDLAGNSLALDDRSIEELEHASEPVAHGRFEPVDPPALALRRKVSEGESLERLVLRSNFDRTAAGYRADIEGALASLYDNPDFEYGDVAERHVVPPKTSQLMSELHGMFDDAIGSAVPAQAKAAYAIAARENGSLLHPMPGAQIELVTPAKATAVATVQGAGEVIAPPEQADDTVDRFAAGQYVLHREPIVPVPYLPDPACGGLALHGVPGLAAMLAGKPVQLLAPGLPGVLLDKGLRAAQPPGGQTWVLLVDMDLDPGNDPGEQRRLEWPGDVRSLRLVLAEQPGEVEAPPCADAHTVADPPLWNAAEGVLTLFLPKGHIARLRYASFVHDRLVDDFGLPRWHDAAGAERLGAQAMAGANWMVTPWRSLTLVHATQQPVCEPWLETVSVHRLPGSQHADLHARRVHLHGPSTGKFEIVAEWEEWIDDPLTDDPAAPGPRRVPHEAQLSEIRLDDNHPNVFILDDAVRRQTEFTPVGGQVMPGELAQRPAAPGNRHEFGDTRFRFVRYRVRGTTRFREYLPPKLFADAALITRNGPVLQEHHVAVKSLPESDAAHDAGAPVLRVAQAEAGSLAGTVVPASGPPQSPEVLFVVPTFRWERGASASGGLQSIRYGNGLRVYLDRPWFSSGDGELLGVVVPGDDAAFVTVEDALVPYVTQWGADPLWAGTQPSTRTRLVDFPGRVANEPVNLIEVPGRMVQVVGHRVHFDASRQLWYCDIELHPGVAYMPFVRLALVRYQPNAISGAEVSRVVLAEFAQVLPRRRAVLKREGNTLSLSVHGPVPDRGPMRQFNAGGQAESEYADISFSPIPGAAQESGRNRMELVLQTRDRSIDSDLGWQDQALLSTGEVVAGATAPTGGGSLGSDLLTRVEDAPVRLRTRGGRSLRFDRMVERSETVSEMVRDLGDVFDVRTPIEVLPGLPSLFDLPVFLASATLPAVPEGREGRLMVREFERYYTDRTVPETRAGAVRRRIVVEERLVYAEVFALG